MTMKILVSRNLMSMEVIDSDDGDGMKRMMMIYRIHDILVWITAKSCIFFFSFDVANPQPSNSKPLVLA